MYRHDYMEFKHQSRRILETHERVKRTLIYHLNDLPLEMLSLDLLNTWLKETSKGRQLNTVRNDLVRIRQVLAYMQLRNVECLNPKLVPVPKRIDTVPMYVTPEEVRAMIDNAFCVRNKFIISLIYSSGIRLSELLSLNRGQIENMRFTVVGKGNKARLCFIDKRTQNLMEKYLTTRTDNCAALVVSHLYKTRMTSTNVQLLIKNAAKRAGITKKVTPHSLRHGFATNFLQNNGNMRYCQELLGHASLETTMKYTHVTNIELEHQYAKFHTI